MPTFAELDEIRAHPEPAYPEYGEVAAAARARSRFVSPATFDAQRAAVGSHSYDWCTSVLGFPCPPNPIRNLSAMHWDMLVVAHERGLDPPLPPRIAAWQQEDQARAAELEARKEDARQRDLLRWNAVQANCAVPLVARPNTKGRRYRAAMVSEPLVHATPVVDTMSGRSRHHPAGRALCETADRSQPRVLGEPTNDPVTCVSCLGYAPKIRAED